MTLPAPSRLILYVNCECHNVTKSKQIKYIYLFKFYLCPIVGLNQSSGLQGSQPIYIFLSL